MRESGPERRGKCLEGKGKEVQANTDQDSRFFPVTWLCDYRLLNLSRFQVLPNWENQLSYINKFVERIKLAQANMPEISIWIVGKIVQNEYPSITSFHSRPLGEQTGSCVITEEKFSREEIQTKQLLRLCHRRHWCCVSLSDNFLRTWGPLAAGPDLTPAPTGAAGSVPIFIFGVQSLVLREDMKCKSYPGLRVSKTNSKE